MRFYILLSLFHFGQVFGASNKTLYSEDNRELIVRATHFDFEVSKSVAAMISKKRIKSESENSIFFIAPTQKEAINMCSDEKFSESTFLSQCTGFLVGENLLMTGAHCISDSDTCQESYWVFDYGESNNNDGNQNEVIANKNNVYSCKKIVKSEMSKNGEDIVDYALIELDRSVINRKPLMVKKYKFQKVSQNLMIIGHPMGLPKMIVDGFRILNENGKTTMKLNSNTFSGNSGSPVFDRDYNRVVGMLVSGEKDLKYDIFSSCNRTYKCETGECLGEIAINSLRFPLKAF